MHGGTLDTDKPIYAQHVNFRMAMLAMLRVTNGNTQAENSGCSDDIVTIPEFDCGNEKAIRPCS